MHKEVDALLLAIGELVRLRRIASMDQTELALRVGLSRSTISAIERGVGVNAAALFTVLHFFDLLDDYHALIDRQLQLTGTQGVRKSRKPQEELPNDF